MGYFNQTQHAGITADPSAISDIYFSERARFISDLGVGFVNETEDHYRLAFCSLVAYDHVPYGSGGGSASDPLTALLSRESMDCDNYVTVAWRLFRILSPTSQTRVAAIGWDGGYFGNHAQLVAHKTPNLYGQDGGSLVVDPTIGLVICGYNFDHYAATKPCLAYYSKSFYYDRSDGTVQFNNNVKAAFYNGLLKPSDLLYAFSDIEQFVAPPELLPTPARANLKP